MAAGFKTATVNASDVAATLTDYPSYVDLSRLGITTLAEAQSVRVYADESKTTEWAREIVSATEMHVKVPSLTSTVDIYVDWDGVRSDYATTATYGRNAVWSDYALVWHGGTATDSSGNATLTAEGGVTTGGATGKLGDATSFDGTNDRYTVSNTTALGQAGDVFMSCWAYGTTDSTGPHIFGGYDQTYYPGYGMQLQANTQKFRLWDGVGWRASTTNVSTSNLQHLAARVSSGNWKLFHNGSGDGSGSGSSITANSNAKSIAARGATLNDRTFNGVMEEMRVRRDVTNITDNWITTEYNNQNDESTFWGTWSDVAPSTGFKQATVNASDVPSTQTDFPSYIDLSRVGITTLAEAQGVRVYSDASKTTELAREIVSATEMHVKIPSLTSTTTIYVDWDDSRADYATTATYGAEAVWSDYRFVWHGSTALNSADGQTLLTSGGITLGGATGQVGAATDFDGTDDIVYLNDTALVSVGTSDFTIQSWVNPDVAAFQPFFNAGKRTATGEAWALDIHADGTYGFLIQEGSSGFQFAQGGSYSTATWAMMHTTFDRSGNGTLYVNGSSLTSSSISAESASIDPPYGLSIGARRNSSASDFLSFFNGKAQQTRMRIGVLSGNWITTEHHNQSDEAGFWGTWSDVSSGTNYTLTAAVGALTLTGIATSFIKDLHLVVSAASFALTGFSATLAKGKALIAETASFVVTGTATSFSRALSMATTAATFTLTGFSATFSTARTLAAQTGEFILTGYVALLEAPWSPTEWTPIVKNSATFTAISKAVTNWTSRNKS